MTEFADTAALGDARAWLREQVTGAGARCPCCSQFAKVYRRAIGSRMACDLLTIYRRAGTGWCYLPDVLGYNGGDTAKLRYWGLLEPEPGNTESEDGNRRTRYRITDYGVEFANGYRRCPKWALVFDGRLMRLDGSVEVSIHDCLGSRFNLAELLARAAGEETECAF